MKKIGLLELLMYLTPDNIHRRRKEQNKVMLNMNSVYLFEKNPFQPNFNFLKTC